MINAVSPSLYKKKNIFSVLEIVNYCKKLTIKTSFTNVLRDSITFLCKILKCYFFVFKIQGSPDPKNAFKRFIKRPTQNGLELIAKNVRQANPSMKFESF